MPALRSTNHSGDQTVSNSVSHSRFVHGGGFRDPLSSFHDFEPSLEAVLKSDNITASSIRGFASIDYRLSPHPGFPQDYAKTPATQLRVARHPDHIFDIRAALAYLDKQYSLGQDYILLGHSAGATLVYQLLMGEAALASQPNCRQSSQRTSNPFEDCSELQDLSKEFLAPLPRVIIGISGVYDFPGLVTRFEGVRDGLYRSFVTGAYGSDVQLWKEVSPVNYRGKFSWPGGIAAILAWSPEDTVIDELEIDCMVRKMKRDGTPVAVIKDLTGEHDVVWEQGDQVARLIAEALAHIEK
jgi:pimeloyl-ACP methyl ester carboxylesterase